MNSPRMPWWRRWFGRRSERSAELFLKKKGFRILTRNWSCPLGELDLIARQGNVLVFVEVRSTSHESAESAILSVDLPKQRQLSKLALAFMKQYRLFDVSARFDVVVLAWPTQAKQPEIQHFENAFESTISRSMMG